MISCRRARSIPVSLHPTLQSLFLQYNGTLIISLLSALNDQVDYFNKRRVLQLRQDLMEAKAEEQRNSGTGSITSEQVPVGGRGRKA